ncbi:MAG: HEAT repeat domain-containing protein [bacterium]|nr:HEAT repeat domain-containing protein [bacterium]
MRIITAPTLGGLAAVLALVAFSPAASSGPQEPSPAPAQQRDDTGVEKARKRILHLSGGTTLRCLARETAAGWEYKARGAWKRLPAGAVVDAPLEKEVRAEFKRRSKGLKKSDLDGRAQVAAWALSNGLLEEGLQQVDRVFAADAKHAGAREAVHGNAHRFRVPPVANNPDLEAACDGLLRWAAPRSASSRELALLELARVENRAALEAALGKNLFAGTIGRRSFSAFALGRLFPGKQVKPLLTRAVMDASQPVRVEAARALGAAEHPGLVVPVAKAMVSSRSPRVRIQAAEALGNMGYAAGVQPLVGNLSALQGVTAGHSVPHSNIFVGRQFAYIQDFDVEVAQFQAVADPQINVLIEGQVTDAGVISVKEYVTPLRGAVRTSLGKLTGASPGRTTRAWLNWWDDHQGDWLAAKHAGEDQKAKTDASSG